MTRRIAVQLVLVVGALVGLALASGVIDVESSSDGPPGSDASIDLIDEATIEIDLSPEWTLVRERYLESSKYELDGFCPAVASDLWGSMSVWASSDAQLSVLLVGSDWTAPELEAELVAADCTPSLITYRQANVVAVMWFHGIPDAGAADTAIGKVGGALKAAVPYLEDQPAPEPVGPTPVPRATAWATLVPDEICINIGQVEAFDVTWWADGLIPAAWQRAGTVEGTLSVDGVEGVFVGTDGVEMAVKQQTYHQGCTIG